MKPVTIFGIALIGLALALVALNMFLPNWPVIDGNQTAPVPVAVTTPAPHVHFEQSRQNAIDDGEIPGDVDVTPAPHKHHHKKHPLKKHHVQKTPPVAAAATPAPAVPASTPSIKPKPAVEIVAPPADPEFEPTSSPEVIEVRPVSKAATAPPLTTEQIEHIAELRQAAQIDAVRRLAIAMVEHNADGVSVISADIQTLPGNLFGAVVVERTPRGSAVESIHFRPLNSGGYQATSRRLISTTNADPFIGSPASP